MAPATAPTPAPTSAPLPGLLPVPAATAAPAPAPTTAPVAVPQPVSARPSIDTASTGVSSFFMARSSSRVGGVQGPDQRRSRLPRASPSRATRAHAARAKSQARRRSSQPFGVTLTRSPARTSTVVVADSNRTGPFVSQPAGSSSMRNTGRSTQSPSQTRRGAAGGAARRAAAPAPVPSGGRRPPAAAGG